MQRTPTQAVVIGGSIAGLLAATVLAGHFDGVVVLDRDALPDTPAHRKGTPQSLHAHALLTGGLEAMERLLPGLTANLVADGAVDVAGGGRAQFTFYGFGFDAERDDTTGLLASRPLVEHHLRQRVRQLPNVRFVQNVDVDGLVAYEGRVVGVHLVDRRSAVGEQLPADLVVDASGRMSRVPAWLEAIGYAAPCDDTVKVDLRYATREFVDPSPTPQSVRQIVVGAFEGNTGGGVLLSGEGDRYRVTLSGMAGDKPSGDLVGFAEFASSLASSDVADRIRRLEPVGDAVTFHYPASRWRRYDRLHRFPEGLLVMGDAMASFNPVYGQGMTVAAREALVLQRCLAAGTRGLARRFFRGARREIAVAWQIAANADLGIPGVEGRRTPAVRMSNRYLPFVAAAATVDPMVRRRFALVINLQARPQTLLTPRMIVRVLRSSRRAVPASPSTVSIPRPTTVNA